jgi:hypothetical protein
MMRRIVDMVVGFLIVACAAAAYGAATVTQAQFAAALGKKYGVCDGSNVKACIEALTKAGIEPPGGWQPDQPINCMDLTDSAILAAKDGKLSLTPQRAVDLLAATCTDVGLSGRDVYATAYTAAGYYFPPTIPGGGGVGGGVVLSPAK